MIEPSGFEIDPLAPLLSDGGSPTIGSLGVQGLIDLIGPPPSDEPLPLRGARVRRDCEGVGGLIRMARQKTARGSIDQAASHF